MQYDFISQELREMNNFVIASWDDSDPGIMSRYMM